MHWDKIVLLTFTSEMELGVVPQISLLSRSIILAACQMPLHLRTL